MKKRRHLDDWDPNNPFHIHTENGEKIVFTEEAYNALPDNIKQQIDAHYNEMNTFDNKYQISPEYIKFIEQVNEYNIKNDVKTSIDDKYLDKQWYDPNWKNGAYTFDDNGLLTYNGQTYAPFGDNTKQGIIVPLRDTRGLSYGHNVEYYPYTIPEQYVEKVPTQYDKEIEKTVIDKTIDKKRLKYIKDNTKYYTPYMPGLVYDPATNKVIDEEQYHAKYPYNKDKIKSDQITGYWLIGDANNEPYLTESQFRNGVKQVVKEYNKLHNSSLTVAEYIRRCPNEYRNRKKPSDEEVSKNVTISTGDISNMYDEIKNKKRSLKNGGIYIKPSHRGRFTALKESTGHSATWFKENGTPAQKKMATFALNAAKWKH